MHKPSKRVSKDSAEKKSSWFTRFHKETAAKWELIPEQLKQVEKIYSGLTLKKLLEKAMPPDGAEFIGPNGELAFIRNDSSYYTKNKYTLVLEVPLALTAAQKREAVKQASNFFERLYIADSESALTNGEFKRIIKKPYTETTFQMGDPKQPMPEYVGRTVWFDKLKEPYGSSSSQSAVIEKRNGWIRSRYKILKSKHSHQYKSIRLCMMIQEELSKFPGERFGKWPTKKRNPLFLSPDNIRRIINTRPKLPL